MTAPSHVLAVDLGTTGVKVAVVDAAATVLAGTGEVLPMIFTANGGVEQDPENWWQAIGRCARAAVAQAGLNADDVTMVAVTSQYTSTVAVDRAGLPVSNVVMWMDTRGKRHNPAIGDPSTRDRWHEIHGLAPNGNDDIGHVAFMRAEWPEAYAAAAAFVEPMDAIAARLTGHVTATQNTMFPMLAVDNRTWGLTDYSDELLQMSTMERAKLPELVPLGAPRGPVTTEAADHLGVSRRAVVAGATIDSVTSAVGTGAIDDSRCGLIIGTTSVMATHLDSKRMDPDHGLTTAPSPLPDRWFLVAENGIGGKALDVFVNNLVFADDGLGHPAPDDAFDRVLAAAATAPPGAHGVMFLPWLIGSMAPGGQRSVRGGFVNLGLTTNRADMARAVLEGVALNAAWLLPHFSALARTTYDEVSLGGGGASSALWGQILAECFGVPVRRLANSATTNAHGAALLAFAETGVLSIDDVPDLLTTAAVHEPTPDTATYRRLLAAFVDFHDRATPFYDSLNAPLHIPAAHSSPT
jgi:xylulokinase